MLMPWHLTVLALVGLVAVIAYIRFRELRAEKTERIEHEMPRLALLGFEGDRLSPEGLPLEKLGGVDVALVWLERPIQGEEHARVEELILTAETPQVGFDLEPGAPSSRDELLLGREGELGGLRVLARDDSERLSWISAAFAEALHHAIDGGWTHLECRRGQWRFERELGGNGEREARKRAADLMARAERVLAAVPQAIVEPRMLERRALDPDEPLEVHWRAARALALDHADTGNARRVFKKAAAAPGAAQMALALWGARDLFDDDTRLELLRAALLSGVEELAEPALDALVRLAPLETLSDGSIPGEDRLRVAALVFEGEAFRRDPEAFDSPLAALVLGRDIPGMSSPERFDWLCEEGWSPAPDALMKMTRCGSGSLGRAILAWFGDGALQLAHAPVVMELAKHRDEDEVAPILKKLRDLGAGSMGQITLAAPDERRGALSRARGERGGLSSASEKG